MPGWPLAHLPVPTDSAALCVAQVLRDVRAGGRVLDARAAPYRQDEWWAATSEEGRVGGAGGGGGGGGGRRRVEANGECTADGGCEGDTCGR